MIDHEMPKYIPVTVRKQVYAQIEGSTRLRAIKSKRGIFRYVVDVKSAVDKMNADLARYREAMQLIVADPQEARRRQTPRLSVACVESG